MSRIIVLFNLKNGVSAADYEAWARETDLPIVRKLPGVEGFDVYRSAGLLGTDGTPPYQYVEILDISDMTAFQKALEGETMQRVAGEFQALADNPAFIATEML